MVRSLTRMSSLALGLALAVMAAPSQAQKLFDDGEPASLQTERYAADSTDSDSADGEYVSNDYSLPDSGIHDHDHADGALDEESVSPGESSDDSEVIKERFSNGSVRVEREVTQDTAGIYVNHGMWKTWDERGTLVAQGEFQHGKRTGTSAQRSRNGNDRHD